MSGESCSNCKFWISRYSSAEYQDCELQIMSDDELRGALMLKKIGMCRRYPPVAVTHEDSRGFYLFNGDATDYFEFVHTDQSDWCGEFVAASNALNSAARSMRVGCNEELEQEIEIPKANPMKIEPQSWLIIANERAPKSQSVTEWFSGDTTPETNGYYERHFTDGTMLQWWDGNVWRVRNPAEKRGCAAHWRQVGDYPCWRGLLPSNAELCGGALAPSERAPG